MFVIRKRSLSSKTKNSKSEETEDVPADEVTVTFAELGLEPKIQKALDDMGYVKPTPIQAGAIPSALQGKDVLGIAQTGTGKTAAFTLPVMHKLSKGRARARMPRCLIVCPTRELAAQVAENVELYGKYLKLSMALLIGGVSFAEQDMKLQRGVDILIATPGRLLDQFDRGKIMLNGVQTLIVDEADRMMDMGFIPDIEKIVKLVPFTRQTLFFSATMPPEIEKLSNQFLQNPVSVSVAATSSASKTITQCAVKTKAKDYEKRTVLRQLLENAENLKNGIIFCNRKVDVATLDRSLRKYGYSVGALHGDMNQKLRMETLGKFKDNEISLLVASDVAARGLDIPDVSHVINFDVPVVAEDYVHRIGRTGRAGREGTAYTLVSPKDKKQFAAIEELIDEKIEFLKTEDAPSEKIEVSSKSKSEKPSRSSSTTKNGNRRSRGKDDQVDLEISDENHAFGGEEHIPQFMRR